MWFVHGDKCFMNGNDTYKSVQLTLFFKSCITKTTTLHHILRFLKLTPYNMELSANIMLGYKHVIIPHRVLPYLLSWIYDIQIKQVFTLPYNYGLVDNIFFLGNYNHKFINFIGAFLIKKIWNEQYFMSLDVFLKSFSRI